MGDVYPPAGVPLSTILANVNAKRDKAQYLTAKLQAKFRSLRRKVEPSVEPDEERHQDPVASLELALLGIELNSMIQVAIRLEKDILNIERGAGILLDESTVPERIQTMRQHYISAGYDLWKHRKKSTQLGSEGARSLEPRGNILTGGLLALYTNNNELETTQRRLSDLNKASLSYYDGTGMHGSVWCHIIGDWVPLGDAATHIVPIFSDAASIGEILFGAGAQSLERAGNTLLLYGEIKKWFVYHHLVVVPVDAAETPVT